MEPCGTPVAICKVFDLMFFITIDCMMQHNNTANTHRSLRALEIISTSTKWGVSANWGMFAN